MDLEIAVVGGGVSGAYSAWRLQQAKTEAHIGLFEYSDRIGGRLYTVTLPGLPHVKAELGGMRYIPSQHIMVVKSLVDHLKLAKKDFPMGAPAPVGSKCNLFYLRGRTCGCTNSRIPPKCRTTWRGRSADWVPRTFRCR